MCPPLLSFVTATIVSDWLEQFVSDDTQIVIQSTLQRGTLHTGL